MFEVAIFMMALYMSIYTFWGICYDCVNNKFTDPTCEAGRNASFIFTTLFWGLYYIITH